eukprot:gene19862-39402_t
MRFDCRGMGDSEGEPRAVDDMADDIAAAIREFLLQMPDLEEIVLWGLGEGASAATLYAHTDARVRGLVLLNPAAGSADSGHKPVLPHLLARCGEIGFWKKVGSGHAVAVDPDMPLPQRLIASLACFSGASLIVIGGADATGRAFADLLEHNDTERRCVTIAGANHTFSSPAWRDEVAELSATLRGRSASALSQQHHLHRVDQDQQVEEEAVVLHVVQVVLQLLDGIINGRAILVADLGPAGHARLDAVPHRVERDVLRELLDEEG